MHHGLAALLALTLWVALTGGGRLAAGDISVSIRDWRRPAVLCAALAIGYFSWWWRTHRKAPETFGNDIAHVGLLSLLMLVPTLWLTYLVVACGGLDSHGYVSAANLFASGRLRLPEPADWLPIAGAIDALAPLGYVPAPDGTAIVPRFPPGLPLVMATLQTMFGANAVFYVAPVFGVGTLVLIYVLMRSISSSMAALLAASLVAIQPVFFTYSLQPMSDVPATFWLLLAATLLLRKQPHPIAAGLAAGMAMLTRPPLGLAAMALLLIAKRHSVRYLAGFVPAVLAFIAVQWTLYGSPLASGYGSAGSLFTVEAVARNMRAHGAWLWTIQTPLFPLALFAAWRFGHRRFLGAAAMIFAAVALPYIVYASFFDDWEVQRFLLPGLVFLIMAAADGAVAMLARFAPRPAVGVAALALAWLLAFASHTFVSSRGVFQLADAESKFPRVGTWFSENAADDDVVLAALHSGSIRYYSRRQTVRWDRLPPGSLADVVTAIARRGGAAYLAMDGNAEREEFTERFGSDPEGVRIEFIDRIRTVDIARVSLDPR